MTDFDDIIDQHRSPAPDPDPDPDPDAEDGPPFTPTAATPGRINGNYTHHAGVNPPADMTVHLTFAEARGTPLARAVWDGFMQDAIGTLTIGDVTFNTAILTDAALEGDTMLAEPVVLCKTDAQRNLAGYAERHGHFDTPIEEIYYTPDTDATSHD